jgi:mono/diheme cytochrome c family protein
MENKIMNFFRGVTLTLIVAGTIALAASPSFAAEKKINGANIFTEKCSMCHGMNGKGYAAIKTPDFTDAKWQAAHPDSELLNAIKNGVKGTAMVSFEGKLSPQEMAAVLKYIRSFGTPKKK